LLDEAKVTLPLLNPAYKLKSAPLLAAMNPLKPWKAKLLFETPMGGVKSSDLTGAYLL
jgi:hypothetical protein